MPLLDHFHQPVTTRFNGTRFIMGGQRGLRIDWMSSSLPISAHMRA